ncbi:hypothetical protein Tco_0622330 [Tanacetum coccineum]
MTSPPHHHHSSTLQAPPSPPYFLVKILKHDLFHKLNYLLEQACGLRNSVNSPEPLFLVTTKVEVHKEHPKVSMVNMSLKKLKHHLAGFDVVVKERTTATAITEG